MKYVRVYSDNFDGHVFTEAAFDILKGQLCNGDSSQYETKEISLVEIGSNERVHDIGDLVALGYSIPDDVGNDDDGEVELTQQSDDGLFEDGDVDDEEIDELFDSCDESYF